jgi:hypothetical protein
MTIGSSLIPPRSLLGNGAETPVLDWRERGCRILTVAPLTPAS